MMYKLVITFMSVSVLLFLVYFAWDTIRNSKKQKEPKYTPLPEKNIKAKESKYSLVSWVKFDAQDTKLVVLDLTANQEIEIVGSGGSWNVYPTGTRIANSDLFDFIVNEALLRIKWGLEDEKKSKPDE